MKSIFCFSFYPRNAVLVRVLATSVGTSYVLVRVLATSAGTSYVLARVLAIAMCLCLLQVGVLSKRLIESGWF